MSPFIEIFVWLFMMLILRQFVSTTHREFVLGKYEIRSNLLYAIIVFMPIIYITGYRDSSIGDTSNYIVSYSQIPSTLEALIKYLPEVSKDKGFTFLSGIIKIIFGNSRVKYFLVLAGIQGMILVSVYRKYSTNYLISIFLFLASTDYVSWMFNGVRQFTAVAIVFSATTLMLKKKYTSVIVLILLASTMHASALLMLPFVFIAQGKAWNRNTILFVIATVIAILFIGQFTDILDSLLSDTQYKNVVSDWKGWNDNGTNPARVIVYSVPTIVSYFVKNKINKSNDVVINFCVNMSIISTGLYVISMFTSGIFIGRLPIYFSLYNYILLPWEIDHIFNKNSAKLIYVIMIGAYLLFYYYQMHFTWGLF